METYTGTAAWKHCIDLPFLDDDEITWQEKRDRIVRAVEKSTAIKDGENGEELALLIEELADVEDVIEFDMVWGAIYDLADYRKWLWIG